MAQPKGFFKEGGKTKPRHEKKGITEDQMSVSVKGNNDTIVVEKKPVKRTKEIEVYKIDDAPDEIKEKIINKFRNMMATNQDDFFKEDQGILYLKHKPHDIIGYEIFKGEIPKYYNVGYGHEYIQFELKIKDEEKFRKAFGISKSLWDKIDVRFVNPDDHNTKIEFVDIYGDEIEEGHDYNNTNLSKSELHELDDVRKLFDDLMDNSLTNLRNNYEHQYSDEGITEQIQANDYDFDKYGDIV